MPDKLHIALVIGSMRTGGAERAFLNLSNAFVKAGHRVDLVLVEKTGSFLALLDDGINIVDLNAGQAKRGVSAFRNYLNDVNPNAIIVAQLHVQLMAMMAVGKANWKGKIILNEQSTFSQNNKGLKKQIQYWLAKWFFRKADAITVVSKGAADDFVEYFPSLKSKTTVIYNPIITDQSERLAAEKIEHDFFKENVPVVVSAGRLVVSKNFPLLIRSFAAVIREKEARLIILGDGPEKSNLQVLIDNLGLQDSVSLAGETSNTLAFFKQAGTVVLSSDYEGLPAVLIEALYCNCHVISTNCPNGPAEILQEGKFGVLVKMGDEAGMAQAILTAINHPRSAKGVQRANDFYADTIALEYLRLLMK